VAEQESLGEWAEKQRVAGLFDRAARDYDHVGPRLFSRCGARLAELADVRPGQAVLDVACGRGASLFPAAERVGPHGRVVGIDLSEGMIGELARDLSALGLRHVETRVMDAEDIRFPDGSFDGVLGGLCLFYFPDCDRALAEMRRVLRPGGRLALSTWGMSDAAWRWLDDLIASYLPEPEATSAEDAREGDFTESPQTMRAVLLRAGFSPVDVVTETETADYASEDEWWAAQWSHGMREILEQVEARLGPAGLAAFEAETRARLRTVIAPGSHVIRQTGPVLYTLADKP
jgi:ubiquinone/menaquinone biosynthesis C-methylase UbiE